jgi:ketosteroid isomerase-like protein
LSQIAVLRQQLIVLQRTSRSRVLLSNGDRLFFVQLYRWFPSILQVLQITRSFSTEVRATLGMPVVLTDSDRPRKVTTSEAALMRLREKALKGDGRSLVAATMLAAVPPAAAQALTEAKAREIIGPWYSLFNVATRGDVRQIQEEVLTTECESCSGYLPGECWGRDTSIKVVSNFSKSIPDMTFDIKEVLVSGDRVIVRGEVAGTPAGDLFGVPHTGKSFRIMAIDIQTIRDGKIAQTFHMENWLSALGQLRAK